MLKRGEHEHDDGADVVISRVVAPSRTSTETPSSPQLRLSSTTTQRPSGSTKAEQREVEPPPAVNKLTCMLVVPSLIAAPLAVAYGVAHSWEYDVTFGALQLGLLISASSVGVIAVWGVLMQAVPVAVVDACLFFCLCGLVLTDWGAAAAPGHPRADVWMAVCLQALVFCGRSTHLAAGAAATAVGWAVVAASDSAERWGLSDVEHWSRPTHSLRLARLGCGTPPCAAGASGAVADVALTVLPVLAHYLLAKSLRDQWMKDKQDMFEVVHNVECLAISLVRFDLHSARQHLEKEDGPLRDLLMSIVTSLEAYRAFMPESVCPDPARADEDCGRVQSVSPALSPHNRKAPPVPTPQRFDTENSIRTRQSAASNPLSMVPVASGLSHPAWKPSALAVASVRSRESTLGTIRSRSTGSLASLDLLSPTGPAMQRKHSLSHHSVSQMSAHSARVAQTCAAARRTTLIDAGMTARRATVLVAACLPPGTRPAGDVSESTFMHVDEALRAMLQTVAAEGGVLHSFDAYQVSVTWNIHRPCPRHAKHAARCGRAIGRSQVHLFRAAIGIASGKVGSGTVGTEDRRAACVIGQPVLHSGQLSSLAEQMGSRVLISEHVHELISTQMRSFPVDVVATQPVGVMWAYELEVGEPNSRDSLMVTAVRGLRECMKEETVAVCREILSQCDGDPVQDRKAVHALRIMRLAQSRRTAPYARRWIGWEDLEQGAPLCQDLLLSDDERFTAERLSRRRASLGAPASPVASFDVEYFRRDVNRVVSELQPSQDRGSEDSFREHELAGGAPPWVGAVLEPPKEWTDRLGDVWRRSDQKLGAGSFGDVYLCMANDGSLAAAKIFRFRSQITRTAGGAVEGTQHGRSAILNLINEVEVLVRLRHDNLVGFLSCAVAGTHVILCLEYVPGGSLDLILRQFTFLPAVSARRYAKGSLQGLQYIHMNKLAHRDFKPANILVQIDGICKLSDFGASVDIREVAQVETNVVGTPLYMSPEACLGNASFAGDVWGFGVTLCQMLTGRLPYGHLGQDALNPVTFVWLLATGRAGPEVPTAADLGSGEVRDMIQACLQLDSKARPTAAELLGHPFMLR